MTDSLDVVGKWWTSAEPQRRIEGRLTFDTRTGGLLRLSGRLNIDRGTPGHLAKRITVHGITHGPQSAVTMLNAFWAGEHRHNNRVAKMRTVEQRIRALDVLAGYQFPDNDPPAFTDMITTLEGLTQWASPNEIIDSTYADDVERIIVRYPTSHIFDLPNGKLTLTWRESAIDGDTEIQRRFDAFWHYEATDSISVSDLRRDVLRPLRALHVVATAQPAHDLETSVAITDANGLLTDWQLLSNQLANQAPFDGLPSIWPLTLDALNNQEGAISQWFAVYGECEPSLLTILSVLGSERQLPTETEFVMLAQGAEAYHRSRSVFHDRVLSTEAHEARMTALFQGQSKDIRAWARPYLKHAYQPSFRQRIRELVVYAGAVGDRATSYGNFASFVAKYRDTYVHGLPETASKDAWDFGLIWTSRKLKIILHACLLRDLGLSDEAVHDAMLRPDDYRFEIDFDPTNV